MTILERLDELERRWNEIKADGWDTYVIGPDEMVELISSLRSLQEDNARLKSEGDAASARWLNAADSLDRTGAACYAAEAEVSRLTAERDTARAENAALKAALEPGTETKAAYMGEFEISRGRTRWDTVDQLRVEYVEAVSVPWTTIKEIMKAIREFAASRALASEAKDGGAQGEIK